MVRMTQRPVMRYWRKGAKATIPPKKCGTVGGRPSRNEAVTALKAGELKQWKKDSGYHQRSIAETAMYRFKQLIGPTLSLRNYNAQVGEILAGVKVMNKLMGLGMPVRQPVNWVVSTGWGTAIQRRIWSTTPITPRNRSLYGFVGSYVFELCRINANQGLTAEMDWNYTS